MDNPANTPQPSHDFVYPPWDIADMADQLHQQLHVLAAHKAAPEGVAAAPFNLDAFLLNFVKLANVAVPFVPGVAGQILAAVLPIITQELGVASAAAVSAE